MGETIGVQAVGMASVAGPLAAYVMTVSTVFGAVMGSFVNCWAWRAMHGESVTTGRSHCTSCGHTLGAADLVPVLSWVLSGGRCRYCGERVSVRYPLTELACALTFAAITWTYGLSLQTVELLAFACVLLFLSLTDIDDCIIPNACIVVACGIRAAYLAIACALGAMSLPDVGYFVASGVGVGLVLLLIVLACDHILGRESMGGGDLKLYAVAALYVGWQQSLLLVMVSCVLGIVMGVVVWPRVASDRTDAGIPEKAFPFGPSIAVACVITLLVGEPVVGWYLSLF